MCSKNRLSWYLAVTLTPWIFAITETRAQEFPAEHYDRYLKKVEGLKNGFCFVGGIVPSSFPNGNGQMSLIQVKRRGSDPGHPTLYGHRAGLSLITDVLVDGKWYGLNQGVELPDIKIGEVFPLFGYLFCVRDLKSFPDKQGGFVSDRMDVEPVDLKGFAGTVPKPGSMTVPLKKNNPIAGLAFTNGAGPTLRFQVKKIWRASNEQLASLDLDLNAGRSLTMHRVERIRKGDVLMIRDRGYLIREIVPPDLEKTKVIGWVEIERFPMSAEELKAAKSIIRPEEPEKKTSPPETK